MNYRRTIVLLGLTYLAGGGCASVQELIRAVETGETRNGKRSTD